MLGATGCTGLAGELTSAVCDCEHCDDWREDELYATLATSKDVASDYGCDIEWEDLMSCQLERGECDDTDAAFEIEDRCEDEVDELNDCESDASDHEGFSLGGGTGSSNGGSNDSSNGNGP